MTIMLEGLNKLKGRSLAELRVRGAQALAGYAERHGLVTQARLLSDAEFFRLLDSSYFSSDPESGEHLLTHFRTRTAPKFFAAFDEPGSAGILPAVESNNVVDLRKHLIREADRIIEGRFRLLGYDDLDFGQPIDWHLEPISGKKSPLIHWSLIDELDTDSTGDKKIVWELNRHQYFMTLGRAYWVTRDERYAETWAMHLSQWMDQNPPKLGLNWVSSLEVAFRAISWLWSLEFFKHSVHLTHELYKRTLKYLYIHARHVECYLSTYSSPNTHLTGEALGLFYLGTLLPEFRAAGRWRNTGRGILIDELDRHVLPDGVYFERATYYHRYTTDFYLHFLILSERNGEAVGDEVKAKLQSLLDHLMHITRPDGTSPLVGDDDGGQLLRLHDRDANDFRSTLSTGAAFFHRDDYGYVSGNEEEATFWLLGHDRSPTLEELLYRPPLEMSRAFPDGGYYVMRDGWTDKSNYMLLKCGPHGVFSCGHSHADALSFELAANGRTMLVDSGTFTYTGSKTQRDYFRSSIAHNTLTVDDESSSVPDGPFSWKQIANSSNLAWKTDSRFDFFSGTHDGYQRLLPAPVNHTRSVLFLKNDYWIMRDLVETNGAHLYDLYFHFAPGSNPQFEDSDKSIASSHDQTAERAGLQIFSFSNDGVWSNEEGWISTCYGERVPTSVFRFTASGNGEKEFFSFLVPLRATQGRVVISEIEAKGGQAFEIRGSEFRDVFLGSKGTQVDAARIRSDFKWAWARFGRDDDTLEELVLVDGHSFCIDGQELVTPETHADYVTARRHGDKLRLEIDNRVSEVELAANDLITAASFSKPTSEV